MLYTNLRAFHAVAAQGGFTRAAANLGVSQPTISEQVRQLERRFHVALFERRGRRVEPTDLGRSLLAATTRLLAAEHEAEQMLQTARELTYGRLRVGADSPFLIVPLLGNFKRLHPGIQISVSLDNSTALLEQLAQRRCDVAILPDIANETALHAVPVHSDRISAVVPRGHAWADRRQVGLAELATTPLVLREAGSRTRAAFERALANENVQLREVLEIGSREGVREAVAAGLGVGIIAEHEIGPDPRLRAVPIDHAALRVVEYAACVTERRNVRVVAAFLQLLTTLDR